MNIVAGGATCPLELIMGFLYIQMPVLYGSFPFLQYFKN
jgi:hypothetical protein